MKIDEHWFSRFMQVSQMLQDTVRQQQKQVMEISRIVKDTNDHISKTDLRHLLGPPKVAGQDAACNSATSSAAWTSTPCRTANPRSRCHPATATPGSTGRGEYVLSNNPNYNPNQHFGGNWTEVKPVR